MKLSVIIPAYNEESRLPPTLKEFARYFADELEGECELIVAVNGSTDRTADVARELAATYPLIRVLEDTRPIGKGGAVLLGAREAKGDWIGYVDADGATSPEELGRLFTRIDETDGIIASRWMKESRISIKQKGLRLLSSRIFNGLIRVVLGLKYQDTQCGAKIFSRKAWEAILPDVGTTRFAFDVDLLFQLKRNGFTIREEPTVWNDVEGSKVRLMQSSFDMFCAVMRMRLIYSPFRFLVRLYERFLAKGAEFLLRDDLFRHTALLLFATVATMIGNVGYQMVVGRALSKQEYTLLATFLALFAIVNRPLSTVSTGLSRYTSLLMQEGKEPVVGKLLRKWVSLVGVTALILAVICAAFADSIASFFHLNRTAPVVVSALALPAVFLGPVLDGVLQGLQRFNWLSSARIAGGVSRVAFGAIFVTFVYPACGWALAGHAASRYVFLLLRGLGLGGLLKPSRAPVMEAVPSMRLYLVRCFLIQVSIAVLMTADVVLVKRYLPEDTDFAYAGTLGRLVVFMATSVAVAMFPKVSSSGAFTSEQHRVYLRGLLYTGGLALCGMILCVAIPGMLLKFLFSIAEPTSQLVSQTRAMGLVMALASLLNINISLLLAQHRFRAASIVILSAAAYLIACHLHATSAIAIVTYAGAANLVSLIVTTCAILMSSGKGTKES